MSHEGVFLDPDMQGGRSGSYRKEELDGLRTGRVKFTPDAPKTSTHADVTLCVNGSSGDPALERRVAMELHGMFELFKERQRKYGPTNIASTGDLGVAVRVLDKAARLRSAYFKGGATDTPDESVADTWMDLGVYAAIALVARSGGWPGWEAR